MINVKSIESKLKTMCEYFVENAYGVELDIPIKINNRLKRSLGRFIEKGGKADRIEFSGILLSNGTEDQIMSVLKHECIHYALFKLGRKHRDGQEDFENELIKYDSHSTNSLHIAR